MLTFEDFVNLLGDKHTVSTGEVIRLCENGVQPKLSVSEAAEEKSAFPNVVHSGFKLGRKALNELVGINPTLVSVVTLALKYSTIDFVVFDGLRTEQEQEALIRRGASRTRDSYHLTSHAVDLVPIINGIPKWDWDGCYQIACAMDKAATELKVAHLITWGGAWDRTLDTYGGDVDEYKKEVEAYKRRHPGPDFIDGPHFQIKR